jgi:hypothetical protein
LAQPKVNPDEEEAQEAEPDEETCLQKKVRPRFAGKDADFVE